MIGRKHTDPQSLPYSPPHTHYYIYVCVHYIDIRRLISIQQVTLKLLAICCQETSIPLTGNLVLPTKLLLPFE